MHIHIYIYIYIYILAERAAGEAEGGPSAETESHRDALMPTNDF